MQLRFVSVGLRCPAVFLVCLRFTSAKISKNLLTYIVLGHYITFFKDLLTYIYRF